MSADWSAGNAIEDSSETRGWFVGDFIDPSQGIRASKGVEVKWAHHPTGDKRPEWSTDDERITLVVLVSGSFHVALTEGEKVLNRPGDYMMWGPGMGHTWDAVGDSVVMTVRWRPDA